MRQKLVTLALVGASFLAGAGVVYARDWRQLQDSKRDLYHARDHLAQAKADSMFNSLRPEHQAHLNLAISKVNEAIAEVDHIEWHEHH